MIPGKNLGLVRPDFPLRLKISLIERWKTIMDIKEEHKALLKLLGLGEDDFERFDGEYVKYEYDPVKGVRLYDPYYETSYNEYIGVDGWSAWSSEEDSFMSGILKKAWVATEKKLEASPGPDQEQITDAMKKKFGEKTGEDKDSSSDT